jgi:hypothetical protein
MGFDYGCDENLVNGNTGDNLKVWPTKGERTALVDADAIPYVVGYSSDVTEYLKMQREKDWSKSKIWLGKRDHANFLLNQWVERAKCDSALLYLTDGANNFRLDIGKVKEYKGQRVAPKPPFFHELRAWLLEEHKAIMSDHCEADDEISIEAWKRHRAYHDFNAYSSDTDVWTQAHKRFSDHVVVSNDKDLKIIPGWHCPPNGELEWVQPFGELRPKYKEKEIIAYEYWPLFKGKTINPKLCFVARQLRGEIALCKYSEVERHYTKWEMDYVWRRGDTQQDVYIRGKNKGKGKFKRVDVGTRKTDYIHKLLGTGLSFFYAQLLTGDAVDNYPGLPGCGATRAYDLLQGCATEQELYEQVKQAYEERYKANWYERLLEQGQLAWMQTEKGELWDTPRSNEPSFRL